MSMVHCFEVLPLNPAFPKGVCAKVLIIIWPARQLLLLCTPFVLYLSQVYSQNVSLQGQIEYFFKGGPGLNKEGFNQELNQIKQTFC